MEIRYPGDDKAEALGVLSEAPYTKKNESHRKCTALYLITKATLKI